MTPMVCNGWWEFTPRLTEAHLAADAESVGGLTEVDGALRAGAEGGELVYRIRAPYALVGGKLAVGAQDEVSVELSWDGQEWQALELAADESGRVADLDPLFPYNGALRFEYLVRLRLQPDAVLRVLSVRNDLQMAPLCMPYLELGGNAIRYVDETPGPRRVEVTHEWVETEANHRPPHPRPRSSPQMEPHSTARSSPSPGGPPPTPMATRSPTISSCSRPTRTCAGRSPRTSSSWSLIPLSRALRVMRSPIGGC